jgi:hypothetical protein
MLSKEKLDLLPALASASTCAMLREIDVLLKEKGQTQKRVQAILGWRASRISDIKANPEKLRVTDLLSILSVLDVPLQEFVHRLNGGPRRTAKLQRIWDRLEASAEELHTLATAVRTLESEKA